MDSREGWREEERRSRTGGVGGADSKAMVGPGDQTLCIHFKSCVAEAVLAGVVYCAGPRQATLGEILSAVQLFELQGISPPSQLVTGEGCHGT